jgi:hypothetical protein
VIGATLQASAELPNGSSFGGLHGGYAKLSPSAVRLAHLSFVSGVELSGVLPIQHGRLQPSSLRIDGASASQGIVRIGVSRRISGVLDGKRFDLSIAHVRTAEATASGWPTWTTRFPFGPLAHLR